MDFSAEDAGFLVYRIFNFIEALIWVGVALGLPFFVRAGGVRQRVAVALASLGFVLFGATDVLEAPLEGRLPVWLWEAKILCAAFLVGCRFLFLGRFDPRDRWFVFGLVCFAVSLGVIALQGWLYGWPA